MATSYQRIRQRKLIYLGGIIALLVTTYFHRTLVIEPATRNYELGETNLGQVDMSGSVSRFVLSSFRGPLVTALWWEALELQKKHDYSQQELVIRALTKLQPHYVSPWKYQGWNLAYNVSVEFDRAADKYLYITKGIRWLMAGENINRIKRFDEKQGRERYVGDPEIRNQIGQHITDKMYFADENLLYRPLLHMSCIPPQTRDPARLRNNPQMLEDFKKQYPRFVRRVRVYTGVAEGDEAGMNRELLAFLEEHQGLPSMWKIDPNTNALTDAEDPWPRWPETFDKLGLVADQEIHQDGMDIGMWWYLYSVEPLPPPPTDLTTDVTSVQTDKFSKRNKNMHSMIFRAKPAQTRCRYGMELNKEGWPLEGQKCWEEGYQMWRELGTRCNLEYSASFVLEMREKALWYQQEFPDKAPIFQPPSPFLKDINPSLYEKGMDAFRALMFEHNYDRMRGYCRYDHWLETADACRTEIYRQASEEIYKAEQRRTDWPTASDHYERALGLISLLYRKPMKPEEQLSLRLTLLTPGAGTLLGQVAPTLSLELTDFGRNEQTQTDVLELQSAYMLVHARQRAPDRLRFETAVWGLRHALASATLGIATPGTLVPPGLVPPVKVLNIDWMEDVLQSEHGPFDSLIPSAIRDGFKQGDRVKKRN